MFSFRKKLHGLKLVAAILLFFLAVTARAESATPDYAETGNGASPVIVGGDRAYPPYEFIDKDGKPAGYNVDLTRAIAEVMGMKVEFRFGDWSDMRNGLLKKKIDILQGISYSDARSSSVDFSPPHTIVHHAIFARK